jgi:hypothetical protein
MMCHIPEEHNPQLHYCKNLKTHMKNLFFRQSFQKNICSHSLNFKLFNYIVSTLEVMEFNYAQNEI